MRLLLFSSLALNLFLITVLLIFDSDPVATESQISVSESESAAEASTSDIVLSEIEPVDAPSQLVANQPRPDESPIEAPAIPSSDERALKVTPALPGLAGFEFREMPRPVHPAELLAAEIEDPGWAANMESHIFAGIYEATSEPFTRVEVECRMTLCGVVVELPDGGNRQVRHTINDYVTEKLGLRSRGMYGMGSSDREWAAVYFER